MIAVFFFSTHTFTAKVSFFIHNKEGDWTWKKPFTILSYPVDPISTWIHTFPRKFDSDSYGHDHKGTLIMYVYVHWYAYDADDCINNNTRHKCNIIRLTWKDLWNIFSDIFFWRRIRRILTDWAWIFFLAAQSY